MRSSIISALAAFTVTVSAHGAITSPPVRMPGAAMKAACGAPAVAAGNATPQHPYPSAFSTQN